MDRLPIIFFKSMEDALKCDKISAVLFDSKKAPIKEGDSTKNEKAHLVFDWDSTLVDIDGDLLINKYGRDHFSDFEWENRRVPHNKGYMYNFFDAVYQCNDFNISILTARSAKEAYRVMNTLESWGCVNNLQGIHFAANRSKGKILKAMSADLFFDDLRKNIDDAVDCGVTSAWIPFGNATE